MVVKTEGYRGYFAPGYFLHCPKHCHSPCFEVYKKYKYLFLFYSSTIASFNHKLLFFFVDNCRPHCAQESPWDSLQHQPIVCISASPWLPCAGWFHDSVSLSVCSLSHWEILLLCCLSVFPIQLSPLSPSPLKLMTTTSWLLSLSLSFSSTHKHACFLPSCPLPLNLFCQRFWPQRWIGPKLLPPPFNPVTPAASTPLCLTIVAIVIATPKTSELQLLGSLCHN